MSESSEVRSIMELFDLPGLAPAAKVESEVRGIIGRTAEESRDLGRQGLSEEDYEAAIEHFKKAVEQGSAEAGYDLAAAYESADMYSQALLQYQSAKATSESGDLHLGLSAILKRDGKIKEALEEHQAAILAEPKNAYLHFKLAETLRNYTYRKDAKQAIQMAIALSPDDPFYHYWNGDLLLELKEFEEAGKAIHAALELSPGDHHVYQLAAISLWGQGKQPEAIRATRLASDLDAENLAHKLVLYAMLLKCDLSEEASLEIKQIKRAEDFDHDTANRYLKPIGLKSEPIVQ